MSKVLVTETYLTNIANAIRDKSGDSGMTYRPSEMADAILNLSGGGGADMPTEATIANGDYWNYMGQWDWFLELGYPIKLFDNGVGYVSDFMYQSKLVDGSHIEVVSQPAARAYQNCYYLEALPKHYVSFDASYTQNQMFSACRNLREIDYDFFACKDSDGNAKGGYWGGFGSITAARRMMFQGCYSLRVHPYIKHLKYSSSMSDGYYNSIFENCYALNEVRDFPVTKNLTNTGSFDNAFDNCHHLKALTFATNDDGTAIAANWSGITIDLTVGVGYATDMTRMTNYNSGLSTDTRVDSVATYNSNKDNEDWWSYGLDYSRYNHDSAVETINSLPDCAEYISTNSATNNTIKFARSSGASTDGGSINNLTEAEIAVATEKGWTVTLV